MEREEPERKKERVEEKEPEVELARHGFRERMRNDKNTNIKFKKCIERNKREAK